MKRIITPALVAATLLSGVAAFAGPKPSPSPAAKKPAAEELICPVTKEKIASVKEAAGSSVYKGKTYYFCCGGCKPMFDKDPAKYVKTAAAKPTKAPKPAATPAAHS